MRSAPARRSPRLAFNAAGFMATRTSGRSPGVCTSWSAKCSWNAETPGKVPAGARISAGKSGRVDRSLPNAAVSDVKRSPVSCMPSPESPAKRMITRSSCLTSFAVVTACFLGGFGLATKCTRECLQPACILDFRSLKGTSCGVIALFGVRRGFRPSTHIGGVVHRAHNGPKTAALLGLMSALILVIGGAVGGRGGLIFAAVIALAMNGVAYFFSDKMALASMRARPVSEAEQPAMYRIVQELATGHRAPMPR